MLAALALVVGLLFPSHHGQSRSACLSDPVRSTRDVKALIRCATRVWHVPGGAAKALDVAACESGYRWWIRGGTNDAHYGVFQQRDIYWEGRWRVWGRDLGLPNDPFNAHSNVIVSIRQAHNVGWGPWSCA